MGVGLLYGAARFVAAESLCWSGWVGMIGVVMILHFGSFHLLSCAWRRLGVQARPLMDAPLRSTSLSEFWGRRWNTAFRDLTHRFLFRPLRRALGARGAIFAGFLFSGFVHDAVISWPASGGYGGPTLFFLFQALGMMAERSRWGRRLGLGSGARGWCFTMGTLLGFGSSPREWGKRTTPSSTSVRPRFIPTRVGKATTSKLSATMLSVHPHASGESSYTEQIGQELHGSSPREWGKLCRK